MTAKRASKAGNNSQSGWFDWRRCLGLEKTREAITRQVKSGHFGQVSLVTGASGAGKRHLMAWLLESLFCEGRHEFTGEPCGTCAACVEVFNREHRDLFVIDPRLADLKSISTSDLSDFQRFFEVYGHSGRRIGVIFDADLMTLEAQNRLLKLLEEPPEGSLILMTSSKPQHLLRTLKSRCSKIVLRVNVDHADIQSKIPAALELTDNDQKFLSESVKMLSSSPGNWFQILNSRQDWDRWMQLQTSIDRLMDDATSWKSQTELIDMLVKSQKYSLSELASSIELRLNVRYKNTDCSKISAASIRARREALSLMRKALSMKIAINVPVALSRAFGRFD